MTARLDFYRLTGRAMTPAEKVRDCATPEELAAFRDAYAMAGLVIDGDLREAMQSQAKRLAGGRG